MNRDTFRKLIEEKIVILDGATGTNLQKSGMPVGVCPEKWILENKEVLIQLQCDYVKAGTNILYAPTFSGNRIKLKEYGLEDNIEQINRELIKLSKDAADGKAFVAGDLTMTGESLYPVGTMKFEQLVDIYKEQISYMLMEDVDLFVIETMMSLQECRAALIAVKESCDLPVMVTLTFAEDGRTLYGTDPKTAAIVLSQMGADAVGVNCSTGPEKMIDIVNKMRGVCNIPIVTKPNAGLPKLNGSETVFDMEPDQFAKEVRKLVENGASIVGGCCGTTPKHIELLAKEVKDIKINNNILANTRAITTETNTLEIKENGKFLVVGERINPTGKKALQAELKEGCLDIVSKMAMEQVENGADILDINMGMNGIDEKEMMEQVIYEVLRVTNVPLCIDSSDPNVIEAALRIYPGRALLNSISLESHKCEKLFKVAKKYGAMCILLPVADKGLPKDLDEKKEMIELLITKAKEVGLTKDDVVVDGLVNTIGANKKAAIETIETIRFCKEELNVATICGLSNISFGLPSRMYVNSTFLAFAIKEGLTMAIANPSQDLLMYTAFASDLMLNKEEADLRYIKKANSKEVVEENKKEEIKEKIINPLYEAVLKGNKKNIIGITEDTLKEGKRPDEIIDTMLIPAITEVGTLFDKQKYFLPQLISSAAAMETAIDYLEPMLKASGKTKKIGTIVIATVAGDIHDIGKNLVGLLLKNHGFTLIDLGKDVPAEKIIETAKSENAQIIALSALMTTTMLEMKNVINLAKKENLSAKIIVGGAAITQSFADEIGANGYSEDAQAAVKLVKRLLNIED